MAGVLVAGANCGKGGDSGSGGAGAGPTNIEVTWTFSGMPADATACDGKMATQVAVTLSGTVDPKLRQSVTQDCGSGKVTFPNLQTGILGMPFLEGALLDKDGKQLDHQGLLITPVPGTTKANIDFFPLMNMGGGGMGPASSSKAMSSSKAASSSSTAASSTAASSSSSASGAGGGGGSPGDAGAD